MHRPGAWILARPRAGIIALRLDSERAGSHDCGRRRQDRRFEMRRLRNIGRLFTGTAAGVIENAAVICDGELIAWCGKQGDEPRAMLEAVVEEDDCGGGLVTAGLIDAHTHPVYAGDRMAEVAMRTAGASYSEVAKAGGGIRASVSATRAAAPATLE